MTGSLADFLKSTEREVVVPIVDDEDLKFGGSRLLGMYFTFNSNHDQAMYNTIYLMIGFVMMQSILPRKLQSRRGEIVYDMEEGGPAPDIQVRNPHCIRCMYCVCMYFAQFTSHCTSDHYNITLLTWYVIQTTG